MRSWPAATFVLAALVALLFPALAIAVPWQEVRELAADQALSFEEAEQALEGQSNAPVLEKTARAELGSAFGGVWIDNEDGATVKLGVVEGSSAVADAIETAADSGAEAVPVRHSFAELERVVQWISEQNAKVDADPQYPMRPGIRTDRNVVSLRVPQDEVLTAEQRQLLKQVDTHFGALVEVETYSGGLDELSCSYPFCDPPLRAGNRILKDPPGGPIDLEPYCSGGFVTRGRGSNNYLFLMTAGHCWAQGTIWTRTADRTAQQLGPFHNAIARYESPTIDAGIIRIMNETYWKARSWVSVYAGPGIGTNSEYPIYADGNSIVGMQVCVAGSFYGNSNCGTVKQVNVETNFTLSSACAIPGDSGSPVFASNTAYGILVSGHSECETEYMNIQAAENVMNVDVTHASKP